jgi:hypothetical protein
LTVTDPDLSDSHTWTVVGGSTPHAPNYQFKIDEFKIIKNEGLFFDDTFGDGNPPPSAPSGFGPTSYTVTGTVLEQGGKAVLTGANSGFGTGSPTGDPFFGEYATLNTNTDSANTTQGLKSNSSFTVSGLFDLTLPAEDRNEYGIRLTDRTSFQAGDSTVELRVVRDPGGIVRVQLREIDFAGGTRTVLQQFNLNPGTHDQILLTLTHDVINPGAVHASFQLSQGGVLDETVTNFTSTGPFSTARTGLAPSSSRKRRRRAIPSFRAPTGNSISRRRAPGPINWPTVRRTCRRWRRGRRRKIRSWCRSRTGAAQPIPRRLPSTSPARTTRRWRWRTRRR